MLVNQPMNPKSSKVLSIKYRIHLALMRDVDIDKFPVAAAATLANVPLLAGKKWHYLDCQQNSIKPLAASVGEVAPQGQLNINASVEGITKETLAYLYEINGEDVICVWENCQTGERFIGGSPCSSGLRLTYQSLGAQDNWQGATIQMKGGECPEPFWFYSGDTPTEAVAG